MNITKRETTAVVTTELVITVPADKAKWLHSALLRAYHAAGAATPEEKFFDEITDALVETCPSIYG